MKLYRLSSNEHIGEVDISECLCPNKHSMPMALRYYVLKNPRRIGIFDCGFSDIRTIFSEKEFRRWLFMQIKTTTEHLLSNHLISGFDAAGRIALCSEIISIVAPCQIAMSEFKTIKKPKESKPLVVIFGSPKSPQQVVYA